MVELKGNRKMMVAVICVPLVLFVLWMLSGYLPTRGIDMPLYTIIEKRAEYEIRQYESYIVAETLQTGGKTESMSSGFNELFQYISGNNVRQSKIKMTAPVLQSDKDVGQKIPMTTPVLKQRDGGTSTIAFIMPPGSRLEELPQPKSSTVRLRAVPSHKVAVVRFSGYASEDTIKEETSRLVSTLQRDGVIAKSGPQTALYNPPWTPPFMRRNEVMIEIE